jgi:hypothetical protein
VLPPIEQVQACYSHSTHLVFADPYASDGFLLFQCDGFTPLPPPAGGTVVIAIQKVYIVINNCSLRRVSDNAVVPTLSMALSLDAGSWVWGFVASLPGTAQALVEPGNSGVVELSAWVNGTEFRVLAEHLSRERTFGQTTIRLTGRGRHAVLDAPYAPTLNFNNPEQRMHQQLFDDVLQRNGIALGWDVDYGLQDWSVPAGVFAHQGSYISALATLAKAGGAYLIPHPSNASFKVRPLYPAAPWNWGDVIPDFVLPSASVSRESIAWSDKPNYNRVFVSGQGQGVLGQVTRQGTAGDCGCLCSRLCILEDGGNSIHGARLDPAPLGFECRPLANLLQFESHKLANEVVRNLHLCTLGCVGEVILWQLRRAGSFHIGNESAGSRFAHPGLRVRLNA